MLAVQSNYAGLNSGFAGAADTIKRDIQEVTSHGGNYYTTPQMSGELRAIQSGIDHMTLDNTFLQSSSSFANKFNPSAVIHEKQAARTTLDKTASVLHDLKNHNATRNTQQMVDNQTRELHKWNMNNLTNLRQEIQPYVAQSSDRIRQFCDHMGVTDRYTGYRHNLNRGNQNAIRLGNEWLDTKRNAHNGTLNVGWKPTTTNPLTSTQQRAGVPPSYVGDQMIEQTPAPVQAMRSAPVTIKPARPAVVSRSMPGKLKSIQEQCGINTRFPGSTEYMDRYMRPATTPNIGFKINPSPDFYMHGRPLATLLPDKSFTEYQTRYEWPDGTKITKLPWLRQ